MIEKQISRKALGQYSTDQSIFSITPSGAFIPKDSKDISELVLYVTKEHKGDSKYSLTARAGGTCMSGGPLNDGIIIDVTKHLGEIISFDAEQKRMWVGMGAYYRDMEAYLAPKGLLYAPYTSSKDICCIGGMVGNNASGEKSFRYGANRDNVRSIKMVCADGNEYLFGPLKSKEVDKKKKLETLEGEIYRVLTSLYETHKETFDTTYPHVRKNAAGYALNTIYDQKKDEWNLAKLLTGSQGTLGIMTSAEIEVVPIAPHTALFAVPIDTFENVPDILDEVTKETPDTVEVYDKKTLELACKEDPHIHKHLSHLMPYRAVLLVEYTEESEEELAKKVAHFNEVCNAKSVRFEGVCDPETTASHWETRRNSYRLLKEYVKNGTPVPIIEDISVARKELDGLFDELDAIMDKYDFEYVFHGHIADGSIRVFPVIDFTQPDAADKLLASTEEVFEMVVRRGGTISTDHNDGIIRTPFLPLMYNDATRAMFQEIKDVFDPQNIFNPRKKLSVTKDYLKSVIKKDFNTKKSFLSRFFSF